MLRPSGQVIRLDCGGDGVIACLCDIYKTARNLISNSYAIRD